MSVRLSVRQSHARIVSKTAKHVKLFSPPHRTTSRCDNILTRLP